MDLISYTSGGVSIRAESYGPPGGPPVVIAHGSEGITDHLSGPWASTMRDFAESFSAAGNRVLMPYYFDRTNTPPGDAAMLSMMVHLGAWQQALADAVAFAGGRPALVGFSLGGHLSLRLRGAVAVVVEFFAPRLAGLGPTPAAPARVQIHHGRADGLVDIANAELIAEELSREGAVVKVCRYRNAGHGFDGKKPGDAEAVRLSKKRTLAFVSAALAGRTVAAGR